MWQDRAGQAPVVVTHHGRSRCILLSTSAYEDLAHGQTALRGETDQPLAMDVLTEQIDLAYLLVDPRLRILEANTSAAIGLGMGRNVLPGQPLSSLCPDLGDGLVGIRLNKALHAGERHRLRHSVRGQLADIQIFPSPGGAALIWRSAEEDEALQRSSLERDALHRLLSMDKRAGTMRLSMRATIVQADPAMCIMCGIPSERLAGARLVDLAARSDRASLNEAIEHIFRTAGQTSLRATLVANDGIEIPVDVAMTALEEDYGVGGALVMIRDQRTN
jgi:PAS domain S-box-containing protein